MLNGNDRDGYQEMRGAEVLSYKGYPCQLRSLGKTLTPGRLRQELPQNQISPSISAFHPTSSQLQPSQKRPSVEDAYCDIDNSKRDDRVWQIMQLIAVSEHPDVPDHHPSFHGTGQENVVFISAGMLRGDE